MTNSTLSLRPASRRFGPEPRGKYVRLIRQFMESGEDELDVNYEDLQNAYSGLLNAIKRMGLLDRVTARRQDGELHLIRLG